MSIKRLFYARFAVVSVVSKRDSATKVTTITETLVHSFLAKQRHIASAKEKLSDVQVAFQYYRDMYFATIAKTDITKVDASCLRIKLSDTHAMYFSIDALDAKARRRCERCLTLDAHHDFCDAKHRVKTVVNDDDEIDF